MTETRNATTGPASIFEVFAKVKREVRPVGKDSTNTQQHFNFRGIDAVVNAAAGALDKHGVITCPVLESSEYTTVEVGQKRTLMAQVRVTVIYRFYGPAGDHFDAKVPGEAMDSGDKGTAKAMSVAYRIALLQALNLPTSDADPDSQSYERSPARDESWREQPPVQRGQRQQQSADPAQWETPAKPVTDMDWFSNITSDLIPAATDADTLNTYWHEAASAHEGGTCTDEHFGQIKAQIKERGRDLGLPAKAKEAAKNGSNGKTPEPVTS